MSYPDQKYLYNRLLQLVEFIWEASKFCTKILLVYNLFTYLLKRRLNLVKWSCSLVLASKETKRPA